MWCLGASLQPLSLSGLASCVQPDRQAARGCSARSKLYILNNRPGMQSHPGVGFHGPGQAEHPPQGPRGPAAYEGSLRLNTPGLQAQCQESPPQHCQAQQPTACHPPSSLHTQGPHHAMGGKQESSLYTDHRLLEPNRPLASVLVAPNTGESPPRDQPHPAGGNTALCSAESKGGCRSPRGNLVIRSTDVFLPFALPDGERRAADPASTPGAAGEQR